MFPLRGTSSRFSTHHLTINWAMEISRSPSFSCHPLIMTINCFLFPHFSDSCLIPPVFSLRLNISTSSDGGSEPDPNPKHPFDLLLPEAFLAFFLLLLLVWFLNREFEVSYRLHYHGNVEADKHRSKIQTMRDQAEWLLGNIIPIHVADQLKVFIVVITKISDLSLL